MARREWRGAAEIWNDLIQPIEGWVIDFGAGSGQFWNYARLPDQLVFVDLVFYVVPQRQLILNHVLHPAFKSHSIAAITALGLTEYILDLKALLEIWHDLLIPGGKLLFTSSPPIPANLLRRLAFRDVHPRSDRNVSQLLASPNWKPLLDPPVHKGWQSIFAAEST